MNSKPSSCRTCSDCIYGGTTRTPLAIIYRSSSNAKPACCSECQLFLRLWAAADLRRSCACHLCFCFLSPAACLPRRLFWARGSPDFSAPPRLDSSCFRGRLPGRPQEVCVGRWVTVRLCYVDSKGRANRCRVKKKNHGKQRGGEHGKLFEIHATEYIHCCNEPVAAYIIVVRVVASCRYLPRPRNAK